MDEIFVRRDLLEPRTLRRLCAPSDVRGLLQTGTHLGAIGCTGAALWCTLGSWWCVPLFMAHGVLLNFLYAGQHELSHFTVFRTRRLNEWVGRAFGFILFYPRTFDQIQHLAHHRFTQDWAKDGELARERYTLRSYLLWMSGITYWSTRWRRILRFCRGRVTEPYLPTARHAELVREARWHAAGYAVLGMGSVLAQSGALVVLWLAPMLAMKFVHQLQNTIEHLGLPHQPNVLQNTRSTRTNALMRWLGWQMQYHTAHHAFPGVPFHRLRELHETIFTARGLRAPSMTYLGFQAAALRALAGGRSEADYADEDTWIADPAHE